MPLLPLAANNTTGIVIFSLAVLVAGYVACFALWYFVFRRAPVEGSERTDTEEPSDGSTR